MTMTREEVWTFIEQKCQRYFVLSAHPFKQRTQAICFSEWHTGARLLEVYCVRPFEMEGTPYQSLWVISAVEFVELRNVLNTVFGVVDSERSQLPNIEGDLCIVMAPNAPQEKDGIALTFPENPNAIANTEALGVTDCNRPFYAIRQFAEKPDGFKVEDGRIAFD